MASDLIGSRADNFRPFHKRHNGHAATPTGPLPPDDYIIVDCCQHRTTWFRIIKPDEKTAVKAQFIQKTKGGWKPWHLRGKRLLTVCMLSPKDYPNPQRRPENLLPLRAPLEALCGLPSRSVKILSHRILCISVLRANSRCLSLLTR
jgi:hypothetical protein